MRFRGARPSNRGSDRHSRPRAQSLALTKLIFEYFRERHIRWISARDQSDDADLADRLMFGVFLDVTQRKQAEEANELLAGGLHSLGTQGLSHDNRRDQHSSQARVSWEELEAAVDATKLGQDGP